MAPGFPVLEQVVGGGSVVSVAMGDKGLTGDTGCMDTTVTPGDKVSISDREFSTSSLDTGDVDLGSLNPDSGESSSHNEVTQGCGSVVSSGVSC